MIWHFYISFICHIFYLMFYPIFDLTFWMRLWNNGIFCLQNPSLRSTMTARIFKKASLSQAEPPSHRKLRQKGNLRRFEASGTVVWELLEGKPFRGDILLEPFCNMFGTFVLVGGELLKGNHLMVTCCWNFFGKKHIRKQWRKNIQNSAHHS